MHEHDICVCGHVRNIHRPKCDGKYANGKWADHNRDCLCKEFKLKEEYKEPEVCPTCGHVLDELML